MRHSNTVWMVALSALCCWLGCGKKQDTTAESATSTTSCETLTGTSWVPNVSGVSSSNHDSTVTIFKETPTGSGLITGYAQGYSASGSHVITISGIDMSTDLGTAGSISLIAETTSFPSSLSGSAWPVLISLNDGTNELVNLSGCTSSGFYTSSGSAVSGCGPDPNGTGGSAYLGTSDTLRRSHWDQFQRIGTTDYLSVNLFPTCNWSSGSPACSFAAAPGNFFVSSKLRAGSGVTYTAKYLLLASHYTSLGDSYSGSMKLTVIRKKDSNSNGNGAIDLNVIFVGNKNINHSRTEKGKQNLDALFTHVTNHLNTDNAVSTGIKIGKINVLEWDCSNGAESYATVSTEDTGAMFKAGSALVSSSTETKAMNLFLVSSISYSGSGTVLGLSGGIVGAMINSTTSSGIVFSSLNKLSTYNPNCTAGNSCPISSQESSFIEMGGTISHEIGHFMGLNHPSEKEGTKHDRIADTPTCSTTSNGAISISSCRGESSCDAVCSSTQYNTNPYCADKSDCQFNHMMWWTTKNHNSSGQGDGNIFSTNSGALLNYSPYVQ